MAYLKFDKTQLINLEYSLTKEFIRSNRAGSYSSSTLVYCNTRKYHGLLVAPIENLDGDRHVLLSSFDETIIERENEFNLGIHKYQGDIYSPRGHKYVRDFIADPTPTIVYRVGGVVLVKECLLVEKEEQVMIRYTIQESDVPIQSAVPAVSGIPEYAPAQQGQSVCQHQGNFNPQRCQDQAYTTVILFCTCSFRKRLNLCRHPTGIMVLNTTRNCAADMIIRKIFLFPVILNLDAKKGDVIIFSASTAKANPEQLKRKYTLELAKRIPRDSFKHCLINSAQQFFIKRNKKTEIIAGFPWFGCWGRDTFIALPGLTLAIGDTATCKDVLDTQVAKLKNGLFPNMGSEDSPAFNSVDAPLWFFWALQQYTKAVKSYTGNLAIIRQSHEIDTRSLS